MQNVYRWMHWMKYANGESNTKWFACSLYGDPLTPPREMLTVYDESDFFVVT